MNSKIRSSFYALLSLCFSLSFFSREVSGQRFDQKSINPFKNPYQFYAPPKTETVRRKPRQNQNYDNGGVERNYSGLYIGLNYVNYMMWYNPYMYGGPEASSPSIRNNGTYRYLTPGMVVGIRLGNKLWFKVKGHLGFQQHEQAIPSTDEFYDIVLDAQAIRGLEAAVGFIFGRRGAPKKNAICLFAGYSKLVYNFTYHSNTNSFGRHHYGETSGDETLPRLGLEYDRVIYGHLHARFGVAKSLSFFEEHYIDEFRAGMLWQF